MDIDNFVLISYNNTTFYTSNTYNPILPYGRGYKCLIFDIKYLTYNNKVV